MLVCKMFEHEYYYVAIPHQRVVKAMIDEYKKLHFTNPDGTVNTVGYPYLNSDVMERFGFIRNGREQIIAGMHVYSAEWFNPPNSVTGKLTKTENTYSIHWYSMNWLPARLRAKTRITRVFNRTFGEKYI